MTSAFSMTLMFTGNVYGKSALDIIISKAESENYDREAKLPRKTTFPGVGEIFKIEGEGEEEEEEKGEIMDVGGNADAVEEEKDMLTGWTRIFPPQRREFVDTLSFWEVLETVEKLRKKDAE